MSGGDEGVSERLLGPIEAAAILRRYGIAQPPQAIAATAEEAAAAAALVGFPVALKIVAAGVSHKSEVGGVCLGLADAQAVEAAFGEMVAAVRERAPAAIVRGVHVQRMAPPGIEMIVGVKRDPVFGPMVMAGLGGVWVELLQDVSLRSAPLTSGAARAMLDELRGAPLLKGYRGAPPADVDALADLLDRVGRLAVEMPELVEMDLNPVVVGPVGGGAFAVDARLVVRLPMAGRPNPPAPFPDREGGVIGMAGGDNGTPPSLSGKLIVIHN